MCQLRHHFVAPRDHVGVRVFVLGEMFVARRERGELIQNRMLGPARHRGHLARADAAGQPRQRGHAPARVPRHHFFFVGRRAIELPHLDARRELHAGRVTGMFRPLHARGFHQNIGAFIAAQGKHFSIRFRQRRIDLHRRTRAEHRRVFRTEEQQEIFARRHGFILGVVQTFLAAHGGHVVFFHRGVVRGPQITIALQHSGYITAVQPCEVFFTIRFRYITPGNPQRTILTHTIFLLINRTIPA